jgi:hypothetical protein
MFICSLMDCADPVQGIQIEAVRSVGTIGGRDTTAAEAVAQSGAIESMVLAQMHRQPHIRVCSATE